MKPRLPINGLQTLTIAALCIIVTLSLTARDAIGYPAGPVVSLGTNPVVSYGGAVSTGDTATIFTAPSDHDIIITDVYLSPDNIDRSCKTMQAVSLQLDDGTEVGRYTVMMDFWGGSGHYPAHASPGDPWLILACFSMCSTPRDKTKT